MGGSRLVVASVCRLLLMLPASREEQGWIVPSGGLGSRVVVGYSLASVEVHPSFGGPHILAMGDGVALSQMIVQNQLETLGPDWSFQRGSFVP